MKTMQDLLVETRFSVSVRRRHQRAGAGLSAESGRAAGRGAASRRRVRRQADRVQSVRAESAALRAARQGGDLAVHERRRQPGGHVRSQAGAGQVRRPAARRQGGRRRRAPGPSRSADAEPVHVQEVRAERHGRVGAVPAHRADTSTRSRSCARSTASRTITCRRTYEMQTGQIRMGFPSVGSWVTYGLGSENQSLPAFVVIHDRARRTARRRQRLERGLPAGGLSGHAVPLGRRSDRRSEAARRRQPRAAARAARSAGEAERARHAAVSRQLRTGGAHLLVRAGVPDAGLRAGGGGHRAASRKPRGSCTAWTTRSPSRSAGSA